MQDGSCPRCGKREVRRQEGGPMNARRQIPLTMWAAARVVTHCCTACGHVEEFIEDRATLAKIAERWKRVT
ncbi:MAG TPA: hypothetical protein VFY71_04640 [Planctomycetota bacterium]|nr:hypothetical protein [Planctomycetota bacterium]